MYCCNQVYCMVFVTRSMHESIHSEVLRKSGQLFKLGLELWFSPRFQSCMMVPLQDHRDHTWLYHAWFGNSGSMDDADDRRSCFVMIKSFSQNQIATKKNKEQEQQKTITTKTKTAYLFIYSQQTCNSSSAPQSSFSLALSPSLLLKTCSLS